MKDIEHLLSLPLNVLAVMAAGYLAYRLAYTGKDQTHGTVDVIFLVGVYALIAQAALLMASGYVDNVRLQSSGVQIALAALSITAALVCASFWRKAGETWTFKVLRFLKVSASDRHITAWETMISKSSVSATVIWVTKKDGTEWVSEDTSRFTKLPFGSYTLGQDGSVAMYVTHRRDGSDKEWIEQDPFPHGDWGAEITYIPASEIARVRLRQV